MNNPHFKWKHFAPEIILWSVRWYSSTPLSYAHLSDMLAERGIAVNRSTLYRWFIEYSPKLRKTLRNYQFIRSDSLWQLDETYVKVRGNGIFCTALSTSKEKHWISIFPKSAITMRLISLWSGSFGIIKKRSSQRRWKQISMPPMLMPSLFSKRRVNCAEMSSNERLNIGIMASNLTTNR